MKVHPGSSRACEPRRGLVSHSSPDIIGLTDLALLQHSANGGGMILHIEPVTDLLSIPVDGEGLAGEGVVNDKGDQLLWKVVGAVVIRAIGRQDRQAIGVMIGTNEVIRGGLAGGVRTVRLVLLGLGECGISR